MQIKIEIFSYSQYYKVLVNTENNACIINGNVVNYNAEKFAKKLCRIVWNWEEKYVSSSFALDTGSFDVLMIENNEKFHYSGKGAYPENFDELVDLIEEATKC